MMSAQSSSSSIAVVQDSLLGSFKATKGLVRISRHEFFNICMQGDELEGQVVGRVDGWKSDRVLDGLNHIRRTLKLLGRKAVAFSGRGLISLMLPRGFFYENKNDANQEEPVVRIHDGVYLEGALDKKTLGTASNSLIQVLHKEYGPMVALNFVDNIQFIINAWLACEGFSIGLEDCIATKKEEVEGIIHSALFEAETIEETTILPGIREMRISNCLGNARNEGMRIAQKSLRRDNNFISTVTSGSKGDWPNLMQITGTLGQQILEGSRLQKRLNHGKRTLPHYRWEGLTVEEKYESQGFITSSFMKGLTPREFISHSYCARDGIIHTAISTSRSGYNQRKIVSSCEDLQVKYDGTVRNAVGTIFQMAYAEDGFNREHMVRVDGELQPMDVGRMIRRFNFEVCQKGFRPEHKDNWAVAIGEFAESLLDFIKPVPGAPPEFARSLVEKHKGMLRKQLGGRRVHKKAIPLLKKEMERQYFSTLIQPGENVGIQAAQNIGREQTQTALDAFHRAGAKEKFLVTGNSRFTELLCMSKEPKVVTSKIYFTAGSDSITSLRGLIGNSIVELSFGNLISSSFIYRDQKALLEGIPEAKRWYGLFEKIYFAPPKGLHCIAYNLNSNKLFGCDIDIKELVRRITDIEPHCICVFSPPSLGQIHVYFDIGRGELDDETDDAIYNYVNDTSITLLEPFFLGGIKGIEEMFYLQEGKEWVVETMGSNLSELWAHPDVDSTRTVSNRVWDIYHLLGIEAAREFLIEEFSKIMADINLCDIQILVDTMTYSGTLSSISRHAMKRDQVGSLGKASFEESVENFGRSALYGEVDNTQGVTASIFCGKLPRIGTGVIDLIYKV